MKFEKYNIADEIKTNLMNIGFFRTTDIQFKTIPAIMNGEDVLAIAQTGTGKTAAFAIPIVNQIHELKTSQRSYGVKCLVLVPTRELAQQIGKVFAQLTKKTRASSFAVYGGVEQEPQIQQLAGGVDVLIATPGRMFDLIAQEVIDISGVKTLVLDEADHMLDLGFIEDIKSIKKKLKYRHQTLFFSATINPKIKKLAYSQIHSSALRIQVSPEKWVSKNISHFVIKIEKDNKRHVLVHFLNEHRSSKCIVFVRTQVRAQRVLNHLLKNKISAVSIHGGMEQEERELNLERFRNAQTGVLIATDVSARGIDLPGITHVLIYDLPDEPENYVHRIGRTGRGFNKGEAFSFCSSEELDQLLRIENYLNSKITELKIDDHWFEGMPNAIDSETLEISEMLAIEESKFSMNTKSKNRSKSESKSKSKGGVKKKSEIKNKRGVKKNRRSSNLKK